jgi:hypothetical protein
MATETAKVGIDFSQVEYSRLNSEQQKVYEKLRKIVLNILINIIGIHPEVAETMAKPSMKFNPKKPFDIVTCYEPIHEKIKEEFKIVFSQVSYTEHFTLLDIVNRIIEKLKTQPEE